MMIFRYLASLSFAAVAMLVGAVAYQTLWPHDAPIIIDAQNIKAVRDTNGVMLKWECHSRVMRDVKGHVIRSLISGDNGEVIALPTTEFDFVAGSSFPVIRQFALPGSLAPGQWCLQSIMHWHEPLSLRESTMAGLSACFDVPEIPPLSDQEIIRRMDELERYVREHVKADFQQHADILGGSKPN